MPLRINITKDFMGNLAFTEFSIGNMINEQVIYGKPTRKIYKEGDICLEPSFTVINHHVNEWMLELKDAIRRYEGSTPDFSQGELKATKYHLEDLRHLLKITK